MPTPRASKNLAEEGAFEADAIHGAESSTDADLVEVTGREVCRDDVHDEYAGWPINKSGD